MGIYRGEIAQFAAKVETTEGTAETLAASNAAMYVRNLQWRRTLPVFERRTRSAYFSKPAGVAGQRMAEVSFELDLYGMADVPAYYAILQGCGLVGTDAGATYTLALSSTASNLKSLTIGAYVDGRRRLMVGARGTVRIVGTPGEPFVAFFRFQGAESAPTETAMLSSVTYDANALVPPAMLGSAFSLGGLSASEALLRAFEIDLNNTLSMRTDANAASGYKSCAIVDRNPTIKATVEMTTITEHDAWTVLSANTTGALAISAGSGSAKIAFAAPVVQYTDVQEEEQSGLLCYSLTGGLRVSAGDDELSITLGS